MASHCLLIHKVNITSVPNSKPDRDSLDWKIFGSDGIPEHIAHTRKMKKIKDEKSIEPVKIISSVQDPVPQVISIPDPIPIQNNEIGLVQLIKSESIESNPPTPNLIESILYYDQDDVSVEEKRIHFLNFSVISLQRMYLAIHIVFLFFQL